MTRIVFFKSGDSYYGFREVGHSGYDDSGKDIVCAAISAMTMLIINTVEVSIGSSVDYRIDEKTTDIQVICRGALPEYERDEKKNYAISALLQGYFLQLNDMVEEYYEYLQVDEEQKDI